MQSPNPARVLARLVVFTLSMVVPAASGCGEDPPISDGGEAKGPPPRLPASAPGAAADVDGALLPAAFDIAGRVVNDLEEPVVGRALVLVDRSGRRTETKTDEDGLFRARSVTPPYDVAIAAAPSGAIITPVVYLGIDRPDPRVEVFERRGPEARLPSQSIKVGVHLPACPAPMGTCWVSVVTASASGSGATAGSYSEGATSAIFEVDHAYEKDSLAADEAVDLHVLVGIADYTQYAYARLTKLPARPGEPLDAGMVRPVNVDATDPVALSAHATDLPEGWQWTLASWLDLPGGATIPLRYDWAPASSMRIPKLAGATLRASAWAQHPPSEDRPYFHRSAQAWTGTIPIETKNVSLDVRLGPESIRPAVEGALSRRGLGLAWEDKPGALYSLVLVDIARGRQELRLYTSRPEVDLSRLEMLGLPRLGQGDHVLDLTTTFGADVDALTQPDSERRARRFDPLNPGAMTYQRFQFMVTP